MMYHIKTFPKTRQIQHILKNSYDKMGQESLYKLTLYYVSHNGQTASLCPFKNSITEVNNNAIIKNLNTLYSVID